MGNELLTSALKIAALRPKQNKPWKKFWRCGQKSEHEALFLSLERPSSPSFLKAERK